ncbi:MAG: MBL fold metallo-hydrolase [Victivallaceae bacterium]
MSIGITALGSGSRGNAFVIHSPTGDILVDAGFSRKDLLNRMEKTGVNPAAIKALLLTHEHDDHARGCRVFCDGLNIPACASYHTSEYLQKKQKMPNTVMEFSPGTIFEVAGFQVSPFSVQHDAIDPVGFVITKSGVKIGIATDLGTVNGLALQRLRDCHILVLESNYDQNMLRNSNRQYYLQKRIMGRHGHLNNTDAIDALPELISARTSAIFLVHVSSECNSYDLVRKLGTEKLAALGRSDIRMQVVEQSAPLPTVWVEEPAGAVVELFSEPANL